MRKKHRKKKNNKSIYFVNTTIGPKVCLNCKEKKILYFYQVKDRHKKNPEFTLMMCRDCLEELKLRLVEAPHEKDKEMSKNIIIIIEDMFKKNDEKEEEEEKCS